MEDSEGFKMINCPNCGNTLNFLALRKCVKCSKALCSCKKRYKYKNYCGPCLKAEIKG